MTSLPKAPKQVTPLKVSQIGVKGYYNIDKDSFVAMTERGMKLARGKEPDIIYDLTYGLVSLSQDSIDQFIELNTLQPLSEGAGAPLPPSGGSGGSQISASASSGPASSGPMSSGLASNGSSPIKSPGPVRSASSPAFMVRIQGLLANRKDPSKYINVSTMREVKLGNKELVYNVNKGLAARKEDAGLLAQVAAGLGGSPSGGMGQAPDSNQSVAPPPSAEARRVGSMRAPLGKTVFGSAPARTAFASQVRPEEEKMEHRMSGISLNDIPESASAGPAPPSRQIVINPRPLIRPSTVYSPIPVTKEPVRTSFTIERPSAAVADGANPF